MAPKRKNLKRQRNAEVPESIETETIEKRAKKDSFEEPPMAPIAAIEAGDNKMLQTTSAKAKTIKITSWNVAGIRAWLKKGGFEFIKEDNADFVCLQETKCSKELIPEEILEHRGYQMFWADSKKTGHAGVALFSREAPIKVTYGIGDNELDTEGRLITADCGQFYLLCVYVPNSGRKLVTMPKRLQWNEMFLRHVMNLDAKKPVIIAGDMNVAHEEIDLARPKNNTKNAGFTIEERNGMTELLGKGFLDSFRYKYPDLADQYTFWSYMANSRAKNIGWRLDYFITSQKLKKNIKDNTICKEIPGSDHCPITLFLSLN